MFYMFSNLTNAQTYSGYQEQWAISATANSQLGISENGAIQATNEPNTVSCSDEITAWAAEDTEVGMQWIKLNYIDYVYANGVDIYETNVPGFVTKVVLTDEFGNNNIVWEESDTLTDCGAFAVTFPTTSYRTRTVTVYTDTESTQFDYEEIDAVKLKGYTTYTPPTTTSISPTSSNFKAVPSSIKRSQNIDFNMTITDDKAINSNTALVKIVSPNGTAYSTRPSLVSGTEQSGTYHANWTSMKDAPNGIYNVYLFVCDNENNCPTLTLGTFTLNGTFVFSNVNFKKQYAQTEEIPVTGNLLDAFNNSMPNANITLTLTSADTKYTATGKTDSKGMFSLKLRTTLLDLLGGWKLSVKASDSNGNNGNYDSNFTLLMPLASLYYNIVFLSPIDRESYFKGENLKISVKVMDVDNPVGEAQVLMKLSTGEILPLSEVSTGAGIYQTEYRLKFSDQSGNWSIGVQALKDTQNGSVGGGKSIFVSVRPVDLKINVISPTGNRFSVGDTAKIKLKVTYPDNTEATGIIVNATPVKETIALLENQPGIYEGVYRFSEKDVGRSKFRIFASDGFENTGFVEPSISIVKPTIMDFIKRYWYVEVVIVAIAGGLMYQFYLPQYNIKRYEDVLEELKTRKKDAQDQYFVKRSIDRETYEKIMKEADHKMIEIKTKMEILKKKTKQ